MKMSAANRVHPRSRREKPQRGPQRRQTLSLGRIVMRTIEIKKAGAPLAEYVTQLKDGALVVTRNGRPTAALVPLASDTVLESFGLSTNPEFIQMLEESRRQLKDKRSASLADVKKEFGLK